MAVNRIAFEIPPKTFTFSSVWAEDGINTYAQS